jgi:HK97 gp10 family phage protein
MRIEGLFDVISDLTKAAATVERRTTEARDRTLDEIVSTAKEDVAVLTGATRDSIHHSGGEAGPTTRHAPFVERGTYKDAPQPFMEPAADRHEEGFTERVADIGGDI